MVKQMINDILNFIQDSINEMHYNDVHSSRIRIAMPIYVQGIIPNYYKLDYCTIKTIFGVEIVPNFESSIVVYCPMSILVDKSIKVYKLDLTEWLK